MKFYTFPAGPFEVNTYLVFNDSSLAREGFLIDPAGMEKKIEKTIIDEGINIRFIINTHCHIDHVYKVNYFKEKFGIPFIASKKEEYILDRLQEQAEYLGFEFNGSVKIDDYLEGKDSLTAGGLSILPLLTPGHSPGSACFLVNERTLFSGDTLFKNTVGRTDIPGGSQEQIIESIKTKLMKLPDDVKVYPGHGESSSIGYERKYNPYIV